MSAQHLSPTASSTARFQDGLGMLTRRVYFHMVRSAGRLLKPFNITVEQYVVLLCIADEGGLTQQELVRRCSSDPRTMGKMLDLLAAKGWIKRVEHATDRRAWNIILSGSGNRVKRKMDNALIPLRDRPAKTMGAAQSEELRSLLSRLADALDPAEWLHDEGKSVLEKTASVQKRKPAPLLSQRPNKQRLNS